jgi:acetyl-CoA acetyltransferase
MAVAVCDPDEKGIGPVHAVPKLLRAQGLTMDDIGLWELKEAFASQVLYCRDRLGIPSERQAERRGRKGAFSNGPREHDELAVAVHGLCRPFTVAVNGLQLRRGKQVKYEGCQERPALNWLRRRV